MYSCCFHPALALKRDNHKLILYSCMDMRIQAPLHQIRPKTTSLSRYSAVVITSEGLWCVDNECTLTHVGYLHVNDGHGKLEEPRIVERHAYRRERTRIRRQREKSEPEINKGVYISKRWNYFCFDKIKRWLLRNNNSSEMMQNQQTTAVDN